MFTGIVETTSRVIGLANGPGFSRLTLVCPWDDVKLGQSIAVNGCCLTALQPAKGELGFDVIAQTLSLTNLGDLKAGDDVNVERSLKIGDRLDGHFVQGHIDGTANILDIRVGKEHRLKIRAPENLAQFIIPQGSVTLDGVSLTVADVKDDVFEVAIIPTTIKLTTLSKLRAGWKLNFEADILAKTVVQFLHRQNGL